LGNLAPCVDLARPTERPRWPVFGAWRPALCRAPMASARLAKALQPTLEATVAAAIQLPSEAAGMYVEATKTSSTLEVQGHPRERAVRGVGHPRSCTSH
jgi:hypothetical protein